MFDRENKESASSRSLSKIESPEASLDLEDCLKNESYEGAREELANIFRDHKTIEERISKIIEKTQAFLEAAGINSEEYKSSLFLLSTTQNQEEFIEQVFPLIKPVIDLSINKPEIFEQIERELFLKERGLSDVLAYTLEGDYALVHLAPCSSLSAAKIVKELKKGLHNLAAIIEKQPNIRVVKGISTLVEERPTLLSRFGFTIDHLRGIDFSQKITDQDMTIPVATISREDFLFRYLKQ